MTREEAIKILSDCKEKGFKHTFYTIEEYHTAIDMAIKALEQEPFRPMVEIDLDYVIKRKYNERDALDKIRAEIEERKLNSGGEPNRELAFNVCLKIIDKYKEESEKV